MPKETDVYYSYLPFSHIYERVCLIAMIFGGGSIGFLSDFSMINFL